MAEAPVELGLGRPQRQLVRDRAELRPASGRRDDTPRRAASDVGAQIHAVRTIAQRRGGQDPAGPLFDRKALAGQHRLAHEEVRCLQNHAVGRYDASGRQEHHVSDHHVGVRDGEGAAVAEHSRSGMHATLQGRCCRLGAVFARVADADRGDNDGEHDGRVYPFARER